MIYVAPSATFEARTAGFATGLTGTIGIQIRDNQGGTTTARTTAGIIEDPAGSGGYVAEALVAPTTSGQYALAWDDGSGNWAFEDLRVTFSPPVPASGDSFASSSDLATRLGESFSDDESARVTALLATASDLIRDATGSNNDRQTISLVTDDVWTTPGTTDEVVKLPQRPVVSVSSVTLDGVALTEGSDWYLDGNVIRRIPASTVVILDGLIDEAFTFPLGTGFGWPQQTLAVTYTHGYTSDEIPATVRAICLEAVVRVWVNPGSVARETIGNTATVYDNMRFSPTGLLLSDDEKKTIRRLFGRTAKSVTMGQ